MKEAVKSKKKKGKKARLHVIYNQKEFLAKSDMMSMAAIRSRITPDGIGSLWISDCNNTMRIWNDLNTPEGRTTFLEKLDTIAAHVDNFRADIAKRHANDYR